MVHGPGVGAIRRYQREIVAGKGLDVAADITGPAAVTGERELKLRVVMPTKAIPIGDITHRREVMPMVPRRVTDELANQHGEMNTEDEVILFGPPRPANRNDMY